MTPGDISIIHSALKSLSARCDGAHARDEMGFAGGDTGWGKAWAAQGQLAEGQARYAAPRLVKYAGQLNGLADEVRRIAREVAGAKEVVQVAAATLDLTPETVAGLLEWGPKRPVNTKVGPRMVQTAAPNEVFWGLWRERKEEIKALGVSLGKDPRSGDWQATLWTAADGSSLPPRPKPAESLPVVRIEAMAVPVAIADKLKPWQIPSVGTLAGSIAATGAALDASGTGAGKTFIGLAVAATLGKRAIVLCPKPVIPGWGRCAKHFGLPFGSVIATNYEQVKTGKSGLGRWVKRKGANGKEYECFEWTLGPNDLVIWDEVHTTKNAKSQNCEMAVALVMQKIPVLALSATAAESPMDMKFLGLALGLFNTPKDYWPWLLKNGCHKGRFGMEFVGGRAALGKIHSQIFGVGKGCRLKVADIPGFPETLICAEVLDFNGASAEIARAYADMADELAHLDEIAKEDRQSVILTAILRARQRSELLKIPTIADMVKEAVEEGQSVVVFLSFDASIDALAKILGTKCIIRGSTPDAEREQNRVNFQENREFVMIANMLAGGVGLDCHDIAHLTGGIGRPRLTLSTPTYIARAQRQAWGRVHRTDGTKSVQKVLFCAGVEVEEAQAEALDRKSANIDEFNDACCLAGMPRFSEALSALSQI